jgi:hypothetical protein
MPKNLSTIARRKKVLRTLVGDSTVDKALREVYDRIDELQPGIQAHESPLVSRESPVGATILTKNNKGEYILSVKSPKGWLVDINSKLVPKMKSFQPSKGLKSNSRKPLENEALLYDSSGNLNAHNNLNVGNILTTVSNATIGGDLTVSGGDIYGPSTNTDLTIRSNKRILFQIDNDDDESGLRYVFSHNNGSESLFYIDDSGNTACGGYSFIGTDLRVNQHAYFDAAQSVTGTTTINIDWGLGNKAHVTLQDSTSNAITFTGNPDGPCNLILKIKQNNGADTISSWSASSGSIKWAASTVPTLSTGSAEEDIVSFYYDGTNYYGMIALDFG